MYEPEGEANLLWEAILRGGRTEIFHMNLNRWKIFSSCRKKLIFVIICTSTPFLGHKAAVDDRSRSLKEIPEDVLGSGGVQPLDKHCDLGRHLCGVLRGTPQNGANYVVRAKIVSMCGGGRHQ